MAEMVRAASHTGDKTSDVSSLRPEEEWVRQVVARTLRAVVR